MRQYILTPERQDSHYVASLPRGLAEEFTCYLTSDQNVQQRPDPRQKLEKGQDYWIRNGNIVFKNNELQEMYVLIIPLQSNEKTCKICRKQSSGSFCKSCGEYLF
jgi:hypothetical protein